MNKNKLGFAWILLTLVMVGMSLSPAVSNSFTGTEIVESTEIVADMDNEYESDELTPEEQTKNQDERNYEVELLLPTLSAEDIAELERSSESELTNELVEADARAVDAPCVDDFNLDTNGDTDLDFYDDDNYESEPDLAPELLEDFQSDDDYNAESGIFPLSDSVWSVTDEPWNQGTPERGQDREVVVAGANEYLGTQEAFLRAGIYTVKLYDTSNTPWDSAAVWEIRTPTGLLIESHGKSGWGAFTEEVVEVPNDGVYIITLTGGFDSEDQYYELLLPEYVDPTPPPANGGFEADATPFTLRPSYFTGSIQTTKDLAAGEYTFNFEDDWGDGWNGGVFFLRDETTGQWIYRGYDAFAGLSWWDDRDFATATVTLENDGSYFFALGGGSYPTEMSVTVIANDVPVKSEFYMHSYPFAGGGDGSFMTTTCINASDYNEVHVSFGYFMDGTYGFTSGLSLEVKAADDRNEDGTLDFYGGAWETVWSQVGQDVDPDGDLEQNFWFTANLDITSQFCDEEGCAEKLSFRFNFDQGSSSRDDYAIDNFRIQAFGQFSDFDKDGVPDIIDDCDGRDNNDDTPNSEPVHTMFTDIVVYEDTGCPVDTDGDGVFDMTDWCPSTPSAQVIADLVDNNGCGEAVDMSSFTMLLDSREFENSQGYAETFNDALNGDADPMNADVDLRRGWNVVEDDGIFHWQHYSALNPGTFEGERSIVHAENSNDLVDSAWLISPHIYIPESSEFGVKMNFAIMNEWDTFAGSGYDHSQGEFAIYASKTSCQTNLYDPANGNPLPLLMERIYTVPDNLGFQTWSQQVVDIPEDYYDSNVCFAFHNAAPGSGTVFVDYFQFYEQPTPPDTDGDGVWDSYPTTEVDGVAVYGQNAGLPIDVCTETVPGQTVVGMNLGVVGGQEDKPLANQPFDVGCNAPISVPYYENFNGVLNMPAGITFGNSDGEGILTVGEQWETLWSYSGQDGEQGIIRADDDPATGGVTQYIVLPMMEIDADLDTAVLSFLDQVPDNWQWSSSTSYHGVHVSVPDKNNVDRSCEVGKDLNGDKVADAIAGVNNGYVEVESFIGTNSAWEEKIIDLSAYVGDWVCIAFAYRSEFAQNWYVDDISVEGVILPPDLAPPTVSEFTPYTGVSTYRADGRLVEITLADSESGIDDGSAATTTSSAPKLIWALNDNDPAGPVVIDSGEVEMTVVGDCDVSVLPYLDRECSFEGMLPEITDSGLTMEYYVEFQDIGFKTSNGLEHPTKVDEIANCMNYNEFISALDNFSPPVPDDYTADPFEPLVCGGPNVVTVGPYTYTLLDPLTGTGTNHDTASMMNVGVSGIDDGNGGTYDIHLTYFSDIHEYVLEYDGDCEGNSGVRTNNWLSSSDSMSLSEAAFNKDVLADCGNVVYNYDLDTNTWMVAQLDSVGIDYNHNGLDSQQRNWADWTQFLVNQPSYSKVIDMPTALTDVNDIVSGNFARHTFSDSALTYDILLETDSVYGDYLTTSDGMTLYVFWGDSPGDAPTCAGECLEAWPAFYAGDNPSLGVGLEADDFATTGSHTTYKGYPLYTYVADQFPTDIRGEGVQSYGSIWHVATSEYANGPIVGCQDTLYGGAPYSETILLCAGAYTLNMEDSFGDGWNGNEFVMNGDGVSVTATIDFGDEATVEVDELATDTEVTINVGGGSYLSEVSWELVPRSTEVVISASQGDSVTEDLPAGTYLLEMEDSYGDGWNGNQWTLVGNGLSLAGPYTIPSGSSASQTFTLTEECLGCVAQAGGGSWISEISWTLSLQADDGTGGSGPSWADIAVEFPGVLEGGAPFNEVVYNFGAGDYTLEMTDSWGDGWNGNALVLLDEEGNVIVSTGLSNGRQGTTQFTLEEGTYSLDVGISQPGQYQSEVGWSLIYDDYLAPPIHFTQLCVTSNGAIAFTNGEDCTTSSSIINEYGWNGFMYQDSDTAILSGGSIYAQVQNILPQKILPYNSENYITTAGGVDLTGWEHTIFEDTSSNDGSMSLDLEKMHPTNPGLYYKVVSAEKEAEAGGCNYDLFFDDVTDGGQSVGFSLIPDATTNAPDDEKDMLQAGGIHQSTLAESGGYCDLTIQLMEDVFVHDEQQLRMIVQNIPEERPDYSFTGNWDYELVDAVLPGTLVPVTVEVTNNDDGIASMGGSMYDHGHSLEVCFSTDDFDDCYYNAWIVNPPAPGASVLVEGQFVLDSGTEIVTTNLEVHTCATITTPGSMDNQENCELDQLTAASYNGITRKGAKVTAYQYDDQSETLEQLSTDNDMSETNDRPIRIAYGVANSVPSFAPSMMAIGFVGLFAAALVQGSRTRGDEEDEEYELPNDEAAVSPVIATILMVAITVVLSGVIYVWASQLATTSTKVTPLLTFKTEASVDGFWEITVTTAETPLALQAIFVQVEFQDDSCEAGYCIITQTLAEPQSYGFTTQNSDSFITYMDMYDCNAGEGTDGCTAEFSAMDLLRIKFNHPVYGQIDEGIVQLAYQIGGEVNVLGEWSIDSSTPSIK